MYSLGLTSNSVITHPSVVSGPMSIHCGQSGVGMTGLAAKGDLGF